MTYAERVIIANQHRLLELLDPENAPHHALCREAICRGYFEDYQWLEAEPSEELVSPEVIAEVRDTLAMFDQVQQLLGRDDGAELPREALFAGYDLNIETEHYAYMEFFLRSTPGNGPRYDDLKWGSGRSDYHNSHSPVVEMYRRMLGVWGKVSANGYDELTKEDAEAVLAARPYPKG